MMSIELDLPFNSPHGESPQRARALATLLVGKDPDWEILDRTVMMPLPDKSNEEAKGTMAVGATPTPERQRVLTVCRKPGKAGLHSVVDERYIKPDLGMDDVQFHTLEELLLEVQRLRVYAKNMGTPIAPADNLQIQLEYLFGAAMPEIKEGISRYPEVAGERKAPQHPLAWIKQGIAKVAYHLLTIEGMSELAMKPRVWAIRRRQQQAFEQTLSHPSDTRPSPDQDKNS